MTSVLDIRTSGRICLKETDSNHLMLVFVKIGCYDHSCNSRCQPFSNLSTLFEIFAKYFDCMYSCFDKFLKLKKIGVLFFNLAEYIVILAYSMMIEMRLFLCMSPVIILLSVSL